MDKAERLREFYRRLEAATPSRSLDEAYGQICRILNEVEDELSQSEYNILDSKSGRRMYPPLWDARRASGSTPTVTRYRTVGHNIFVGENGAITISTIRERVDFERAGEDGRMTGEL